VPGSRLDQIPQAKRGAFLVELEKLQPEKPARMSIRREALRRPSAG